MSLFLNRLAPGELTLAQHSKLDSIARDDPEAKVIGYDGGPLIRRSGGRVQRCRNTGRLTPVRKP